MSKRFVVCSPAGDSEYFKEIEFVNNDTNIAISAFHTLYGAQSGYLLFEQVACSETARSCDEADDTSGEDSVQPYRYPGPMVNPYRS